MTHVDEVTYLDATEPILALIASDFGERTASYLQGEDGFAVAAMANSRPVGFIGLSWRQLPQPLPGILECFIDIIEVGAAHQRRGIARKLLDITEDRARERGAYQIRAWSSEDKTEAIPMWRALGFGLAPAVIYPGGQEVRGFFVTKVLAQPEG